MRNVFIVFILLAVITSCNNGKNGDAKLMDERVNNRKKRELDEALIGTWKNTEVLGAGTEMSFATEKFIQFEGDGTMKAWTGQSAGAGMDFDDDAANAGTGNWYTSGNSLHLIDPATNQDAETYYTVSESGLLLHNGGSQKQAFARVR
jgi:hypothetical protein